MGIIPIISLVVLITSLLIYLLLTSKGRFLLKSLVTKIKRQEWRFKTGKLNRLKSKFSKTITIAAIILAAVIAGNSVSAQVTGLPASLKSVSVPEPDNLGDFVQDKVAAIKLGKTLFWDIQVGSDGLTSCATCHFHAGADNRSKNQIAPGLLRINADRTENPDTIFNVGGAPNYQLRQKDFPFHKLSDPNDSTTVVSDSNDVSSSQGVANAKFIDVKPGSAEDEVKTEPDQVFNVGGTNVRRVQPRNTPTVINAAFNFRNFWDGRAQDIFNGVNPFGLRDPNALVVKAEIPNQLKFVKVSLNNASLASQAVGPPLSSFESSADGRTFQEIGDKFGRIDSKKALTGILQEIQSRPPLSSIIREINDKLRQQINERKPLGPVLQDILSIRGTKLPRILSQKLSRLRPLGKQLVHPQDSVLGADSRWPNPGLNNTTYEQLVKDAFKPEWWRSTRLIQVDGEGRRTFVNIPDNSSQTDEYTLLDYNFSLFFGLAIQLYESTLIADDTPYDRFLEGNTRALTQQQQRGKQLFETKAACIFCHSGLELTSASVSNVKNQRLRATTSTPKTVSDRSFFNIGVRPTLEDTGVGGQDPFGNPLSESRVAALGKFPLLLGSSPNVTVNSNDTVVADGNFKTPGLRNIELTAPYFHNGGYLTLPQVVDFYNRGGDFRDQGVLRPLGLTETEKEDLVAFLKGLTDERVRFDKAPFDHPQLFVPNGHPGSTTSVINDGTGKATDTLLEIPAVGRNGGTGTPNFLN
ncbi:cytochrome C peroxidase [Nostoc sp. CHAB 5836]|uniref:cytochrome-c peroxidase n=1 Tax=Nostoc sp. CHAB 5836 TaxID=2780404 RepID=UPI001E47AE96|nr:cytochrome c peroxidase [Nostoc sp. CHAB 5836]MCC5614634.1 cytochrome C peroxidase [Nostoc sp. CHAB 5836]